MMLSVRVFSLRMLAGPAVLLVAIALVSVAGCCRTGSGHQCNFTPTDAGGADSGLNCVNLNCEAPKVCCITKIAPFTSCVDPADYLNDGCELYKPDVPECASSQECNGGVCCYQKNLQVTGCQTPVACPGDGVDTYRVCSADQDCATFGSRMCLGAEGDPLNSGTLGVCAP